MEITTTFLRQIEATAVVCRRSRGLRKEVDDTTKKMLNMQMQVKRRGGSRNDGYIALGMI